MPQHIKKGANALVAEALDGLPAISVEEAMPLVDAGTHVFVDVREGSEQAKGVISGAVISSRGLLEFHIDPDSPAHKPELASDKTFIFYCACRWPIRPCRQGGCRDGHGTSGQSDRWLQRVEKGRRTSIGIRPPARPFSRARNGSQQPAELAFQKPLAFEERPHMQAAFLAKQAGHLF